MGWRDVIGAVLDAAERAPARQGRSATFSRSMPLAPTIWTARQTLRANSRPGLRDPNPASASSYCVERHRAAASAPDCPRHAFAK